MTPLDGGPKRRVAEGDACNRRTCHNLPSTQEIAFVEVRDVVMRGKRLFLFKLQP